MLTAVSIFLYAVSMFLAGSIGVMAEEYSSGRGKDDDHKRHGRVICIAFVIFFIMAASAQIASVLQ